MTTHRSDDPLDTLLQELGPEDPPAGFTESVLSKVARTRMESSNVQASGNVIPFKSGGIAMSISKKAMWGLAAAAAVILVVFVSRGFPTVDRGTEGAIGAAKKYQAPQLTASDVVTGDASVQEFLQSETFDHLMKDPEAVAMLSNASMRAALSDAAFADAIRQVAVRDALRSGMIARIFDDAAARAALEDALKSKLTDSAVRASQIEASVRSAARADLKSALEDANIRQALQNDAFRQKLDDASFRQALARHELSAALKSASFEAALSQRAFSAALKSAQFDSALKAR